MFRRLMTLSAVAAFAPSLTHAAITSLDLGNYTLTATYELAAMKQGPKAWEASAVTWNQDTGTLFVLEDEGRKLYQVSTTGEVLNSMSFGNGDFNDPEGITYIGNGEFVMAEEREQNLYRFTYTAGGTVFKDPSKVISIGDFVNNIGIEGVSYDPVSGNIFYVKEKDPQLVNELDIDFVNGTFTNTSVFNPALLGLTDLADIQALSTVESLLNTPDARNFLIISQESRRVLEVSPSGSVLSYFDLPAGRINSEGITIDDEGNIYIVDEGSDNDSMPRMMVYSPTPVPLPAAAWFLISGLGALAGIAHRRRD